MRRNAALLAAILLLACGSESADAPTDATPVDSTTDAIDSAETSTSEVATADAADAADATSATLCPSSPPRAGDPCVQPTPPFLDGPPGTRLTYACDYGDDPHGVCRTIATCWSGHWSLSAPSAGCGATAPTCPSTFGDREGTSCVLADPPASTAPCDYPEGRCDCEPCKNDAGVSGFWHCIAWTTAPAGCPVDRPQLGSECADEGHFCAYSDCCRGPYVGSDMACAEGHWWATTSTACSCAYPACP